jgi:predicted RNA-binding Zn ribbon-like protein
LVETSDYVAGMRLDGGHLALDFVNTLGGTHEDGPQPHDEHLRSYDDLVAWSVRVGTLRANAAERLVRGAASHPRQATRTLAEAIELRERAYAVLRSIVDGRPPPQRELARLLEDEREALRHARLAPGGSAFSWRWEEDDDLRLPLWPLAHGAVELLTEGPLDRLKLCDRCRWLFLDRSKNRSRRWCSMEECGLAVKKRRYVERRRARSVR